MQATSQDRIALNKNETVTLTVAADAGMLLVSELAERTGLHPMIIDRCRKQLEGVHRFLASGPVRTGKGKGKHGVAVCVTEAGYEWLGRKVKGMRGHSSLEHQYWSTVIARATGHLETTINGKSCDVIAKYDQDHKAFLDAVIDQAHRLTDDIITPTAGSIIAIEIESSSPERTAPANVERNTSVAHIPLTIIATSTNLLHTYASLKEQLAPEYWPHTLLVDGLWLVDISRQQIMQQEHHR